MQADAIKLITQYYDNFNKEDIVSFLGLLDEQVVHEINQGEAEIGVKAFAEFMERMNKAYSEKVKNLIVMANQEGTRASAEFVIEGTYKATDKDLPTAHNQRYELRCGAFFEINQNKITRVTNYYNMQDWLKQVKE